MSVIKRCFEFMTQRSTVLVVQALLSIWSGAAKKDLAKFKTKQHALPLTSHTELTSTTCMIVFHG